MPREKEPLEAYSDAAGTARFHLKATGWVGVRVMVPEEKSGERDGKKYELIRHYSTLTFFNGK